MGLESGKLFHEALDVSWGARCWVSIVAATADAAAAVAVALAVAVADAVAVAIAAAATVAAAAAAPAAAAIAATATYAADHVENTRNPEIRPKSGRNPIVKRTKS